MNTLNPLEPFHAYMLGFIYGDGSLSKLADNRKKGKLEIEIQQGDDELLYLFQSAIPKKSVIRTRERVTNFSSGRVYRSTVLTIHDWAFREELNRLGVPFGKKSDILVPPKVAYSKRDFWRGVLDADGSLGLTSNGLPFVSFVTKSAQMAQDYLVMSWQATKKARECTRNARDGVFNLMIMLEDAQALVRYLYYPGAVALGRKAAKAAEVLEWVRPDGMKMKSPGSVHKWSDGDVAYLLGHTNEEAVKHLGVSMEAAKQKRNKVLRRARV